MKLLNVYTDGSCKGNPGDMGYAFCIEHSKKEYTDSGALGYGTSNRAELNAILKALEFIEQYNLLEGYDGVNIHTDSSYCVKGATKFMTGWKERNWRTYPHVYLNTSTVIKNVDEWRAIDKWMEKWYIKWTWVKAHDGHARNEQCDSMAKKASGGKK